MPFWVAMAMRHTPDASSRSIGMEKKRRRLANISRYAEPGGAVGTRTTPLIFSFICCRAKRVEHYPKPITSTVSKRSLPGWRTGRQRTRREHTYSFNLCVCVCVRKLIFLNHVWHHRRIHIWDYRLFTSQNTGWGC